MSYSVDNYNYIPNEFKKYKPKSISIKPNIVDIHVDSTCMNYYIPMYYECEYIYNIPNSKVIVTTFKFVLSTLFICSCSKTSFGMLSSSFFTKSLNLTISFPPVHQIFQ